MIQTPEDRRPPLTPQLAMRVAVLGSVALALFAIIFFRLWFLQVLSGHNYIAQAEQNQTRSVLVPAPRGEVLDANGDVLVDNTKQLDVQIVPSSLPVKLSQANVTSQPGPDLAVYRRVARVLGISTTPHPCQVTITYPSVQRLTLSLAQIPCEVAHQLQITPYGDITVKTDVAPDVFYYLMERQQKFEGVQVNQVYARQYPFHDLAAQLFGTVGALEPGEVAQSPYKGLPASDIVGQSGLEYSYNRYLQGKDGKENFEVNAEGDFVAQQAETAPTVGENLKLSLDMNVQRVGQAALQESINENAPADAGSFVAMNPYNGEVYAMGSLPSFDPNVFTHPLSYSQYNALFGPGTNDPQLNRAIASVGPTGSTFKPLTATAALESGAWSLDETFDDTGCFQEGSACLTNSGHVANGVINLVDALRVSDDIFFYNLGRLLNNPAPQGGALQAWAQKYGIGQLTGIDVGGEEAGTLPSPEWRANENKLEEQCDNLSHPTAEFPNHPDHKLPLGGCGLADGSPWTYGDNVNLAVGQGDVQVTPLQLAVAYSAIANGGTIVRPHVGLDIQDQQGRVLQTIDPPAVRHLNINPIYLDAIREGLHEAAQSPGGTSDDVFGNFPETVYGKTGTAQYINDGVETDYAWYSCFVTDTSKPIEVVVHVEKGGFGAVGAAPVAREILSQWFFGKPGAYTAGTSADL